MRVFQLCSAHIRLEVTKSVRDTAVGVATGLRDGRTGVRILVRDNFFLPQNVQTFSWSHLSLYPICTAVLSKGGKSSPEREAGHSPPSSVEFKNKSKSTAPPSSAIMASTRADLRLCGGGFPYCWRLHTQPPHKLAASVAQALCQYSVYINTCRP